MSSKFIFLISFLVGLFVFGCSDSTSNNMSSGTFSKDKVSQILKNNKVDLSKLDKTEIDLTRTVLTLYSDTPFLKYVEETVSGIFNSDIQDTIIPLEELIEIYSNPEGFDHSKILAYFKQYSPSFDKDDIVLNFERSVTVVDKDTDIIIDEYSPYLRGLDKKYNTELSKLDYITYQLDFELMFKLLADYKYTPYIIDAVNKLIKLDALGGNLYQDDFVLYLTSCSTLSTSNKIKTCEDETLPMILIFSDTFRKDNSKKFKNLISVEEAIKTIDFKELEKQSDVVREIISKHSK